MEEIMKQRKLNAEKRKKEEIIRCIEKNPEMLENLSLENLKRLNTIYDEKIEENYKIIENLKNEIKNLKNSKKSMTSTSCLFLPEFRHSISPKLPVITL